MTNSNAVLYIVATPIGNLEDITIRALKILASVDVILCEDTRMTKRLLTRHEINTATISYHAYSKLSKVEQIIQLLKEGKKLALVSDAGTPGISDPGAELVSIIRRELVAEISDGSVKIESVPGPSALTASLSISGVPCANFIFLGFLPHKKGRETLFKEIVSSQRTCVFYESPHRIMKTLESLNTHFEFISSSAVGDYLDKPNKKVTVCRELTKVFEEVVGGSAGVVLDYFSKNFDKVRGEFVVIVSNL